MLLIQQFCFIILLEEKLEEEVDLKKIKQQMFEKNFSWFILITFITKCELFFSVNNFFFYFFLIPQSLARSLELLLLLILIQNGTIFNISDVSHFN